MQDDARKRHRLLLVLREDGLHDPVQAVRLAGGPVMGHLHADQLPIAPAHPFHFVDRPLGVLVRAGEDHVVLVFQRRHHRFQHRRDHVVLQPRGHHDRQRLFLLGAQLLGRQRGVAALDRQRPLQFAQPEPGVDEQVIQAREQDDHAHDGGHDYQPAVVVRDEVRPVERRHGASGLRVVLVFPAVHAQGHDQDQDQDEHADADDGHAPRDIAAPFEEGAFARARRVAGVGVGAVDPGHGPRRADDGDVAAVQHEGGVKHAGMLAQRVPQQAVLAAAADDFRGAQVIQARDVQPGRVLPIHLQLLAVGHLDHRLGPVHRHLHRHEWPCGLPANSGSRPTNVPSGCALPGLT
ncbi:hypothetical protein G6F22_014293 [Rhizopus arrhizus]|nr:hypothetical protein G6F22_014293 [Rhizopus arrhizus]